LCYVGRSLLHLLNPGDYVLLDVLTSNAEPELRRRIRIAGIQDVAPLAVTTQPRAGMVDFAITVILNVLLLGSGLIVFLVPLSMLFGVRDDIAMEIALQGVKALVIIPFLLIIVRLFGPIARSAAERRTIYARRKTDAK